jgi:hypothetical protein
MPGPDPPPGGSAVVVDAVHEATAGVYVVQVLPLEPVPNRR